MRPRKKRACDEYYEPEIFFGFGSAYDLRDAPDGPPPRLWGMRSVSRGAAVALSIKTPIDDDAPSPVGFAIPVATPAPTPKSKAKKT